MSAFDSILGQITGNLDIASLAGKVGLDPAMAEQALAALGAAHSAPEDTVGLAAQKTGLDPAMLTQMVSQIGGEGALGQLSGLLQGQGGLSGLAGMLDRDGDGNPLDDLAGMAKGLFGN